MVPIKSTILDKAKKKLAKSIFLKIHFFYSGVVDIAKSLANEIWHPQIIFSKAQDIVKNKGYGYNDFFQFQKYGLMYKEDQTASF